MPATPPFSPRAWSVVVRQVAGVVAQGTAAGVGGDEEGLFAVLDDIPKTAVGKVGNVDQHAQLVHAADAFQAKGLQPFFHDSRVFGVGVAQAVLGEFQV